MLGKENVALTANPYYYLCGSWQALDLTVPQIHVLIYYIKSFDELQMLESELSSSEMSNVIFSFIAVLITDIDVHVVTKVLSYVLLGYL